MIVGSHLAKRVERLRDVPIPTIPSIQATLAAHGRDDAPHSGFTAEHVGSSRWIEPWEGAKILRGAPFHVPCLSDQIASTSFADVGRLLQLFWAYFREQRAPVMIDDSIMAYAVQGIRRMHKPLQLPSPRASAEVTGAELQTKVAGDLDADALARALSPEAEAGAVGAPWADDSIVRLLARAEAAGTLEAITPANIAHTEILLWDTHATGDVQRRDFEFRCGWGAGWVKCVVADSRGRGVRAREVEPISVEAWSARVSHVRRLVDSRFLLRAVRRRSSRASARTAGWSWRPSWSCPRSEH